MPVQAAREGQVREGVLGRRRLPVGAEVMPGGGVHFRVWAPKRRDVAAVIDGRGGDAPLQAEGNGYFSGLVSDASAGTLYRFRLDGGDYLYPDPVSRFQPQGVHGPSQVVDHRTYRWDDDGWAGVGAEGQVLYEMHF